MRTATNRSATDDSGAGPPRWTTRPLRRPVPRPCIASANVDGRHRRVLFLTPGPSPRLARHLQARRAGVAATPVDPPP